MAREEGIGYVQISGGEQEALGRNWGIPRGTLIRRIFNAVTPVAVVSRFRGELEGSLTGLTAFIDDGPFDHRPACEFFSSSREWNLHRLNVWYSTGLTPGGGVDPRYDSFCSLFTPPASYNPVEVFSSPVLFPALITNPKGDLGTVRGQTGWNPIGNPTGSGFLLHIGQQVGGVYSALGPTRDFSDDYTSTETNVGVTSGQQKHMENVIHFDPPLRMPKFRTLDVQVAGPDVTFSPTFGGILMGASILYTEIAAPGEALFGQS